MKKASTNLVLAFFVRLQSPDAALVFFEPVFSYFESRTDQGLNNQLSSLDLAQQSSAL